MAFTKTMVPLRARESFFRDEFFSDCWEIMERQKKEFEQKCADSLSSKETFGNNKLLGSLDSRQGNSGDEFQYSPVTRRYNQPRYHPASLMMMDSDHLARKYSSGLGIHSDRDNFKVSLDVQQFAPEELTVKTVDSTIIIEGRHEEKEDNHGLVSRHFQRKYTLPADVKVEEVQCSFTADGRLHVTAPRHQPTITSSHPTQNDTTSSTRSDAYKKMASEDHKIGSSTSTTNKGATATTSISDKFREEIQQAKDEFEKSTAELREKRAERKDAFREEIKQAKEDFEKSTAEVLANRAERKDAFREEIRKAQEDFDKSASGLFSRDREEFKHSRLLRMFEPHFTAFPEFDPLPFWRRSGKNTTLADEFDKKSSLFDEFASSGRFGKSSLMDSNGSLTSTTRELHEDQDDFKVILDVHEFKPEELSVKTFDYYVEIEAKHEAKQDPHGFITRHFKRKYTLPRDVKPTDVQCNLSSEGILLVTAPRQKVEESVKNPHHVPIQQKDTIQEASSTRSQRIQQEESNSQRQMEEQQIPRNATPPREKVYQNVSTVHQIFTEKKAATGAMSGEERQAEHTIPMTQSHGTSTTSTTTAALRDTGSAKAGERVIPIDQELQSPCPRVDFPESRPESSASSIPFDFSRGKSEEPTSVASSVPPTFENLTGTTAGAPGERIIRIQVAS